MDNFFILFLVSISSLFAYFALSKKTAPLRDAISALFEWAGAFSLFFAANVACGIFILFLIRTFTARFVSLYALQNILLVVLSALQAFVFHYLWKRRSNP